MRAESTRGDIRLCQRRRAKHARGCGRGSPYLAWVVLYPTGGSDLPERSGSRSVVRQLRRGMLSGWRAHSRGTSGEGKTRNPFTLQPLATGDTDWGPLSGKGLQKDGTY